MTIGKFFLLAYCRKGLQLQPRMDRLEMWIVSFVSSNKEFAEGIRRSLWRFNTYQDAVIQSTFIIQIDNAD